MKYFKIPTLLLSVTVITSPLVAKSEELGAKDEYVLQVGAFKVRENCEKLAGLLDRKNIDSTISLRESKKIGPYYALQVRRLAGIDKARAVGQKILEAVGDEIEQLQVSRNGKNLETLVRNVAKVSNESRSPASTPVEKQAEKVKNVEVTASSNNKKEEAERESKAEEELSSQEIKRANFLNKVNGKN